jgi:hypothetical protein
MVVLVVCLLLIVALCILRTEHLIASNAWIMLRGEQWQQKVLTLGPEQLADPTLMWGQYREAGGGKLPWLFFGIKSYRLYAWSHGHPHRRLRAGALKATRFLWRQYTFAPLMATVVIVCSFVPNHLPSIARYALAGIAMCTAISALAIALESLLAAWTFKSWAVQYHRFPSASTTTNRPDAHELLVVFGSIFIAIFVGLALVIVTATRLHGFTNYSAQAPLSTRLGIIVQLLIPPLALGNVANAIGLLTALLILALYVSYAIGMLTIVGPRLWNASSRDIVPSTTAAPSGPIGNARGDGGDHRPALQASKTETSGPPQSAERYTLPK